MIEKTLQPEPREERKQEGKGKGDARDATRSSTRDFLFLSNRILTDPSPGVRPSTPAHAAIDAAANPGGDAGASSGDGVFIDAGGVFGISPFTIPRGLAASASSEASFELTAPSTRRNAARVLRAMQLTKPILLEGSPGVGKTSLIAALAKASGHELVRVNLSEQTDMMDLLGADLPADGGAAGEFRWADGAFLAALKNGHWVLLDELNLAPQPVLEGLNAALDHRAEVFVPELGETFKCPPTFRVFAAQNPVQEGGGRKGLPKSFLNRFTRVHVEPMESSDLTHIAHALYPTIPAEVVAGMVRFTSALAEAAAKPGGSFARAGAPWEFNLRDLLRWCDLTLSAIGDAVDDGDGDGDEEDAITVAQSAVDAWTEARKLAALNEEETRTLTNRVQELEKELQQNFEVKLTGALSKDTEPPVEEEEEKPINMDHARQFVVEQRQASEPLRSKTPEPPRSKTPSGPRSKTPSIPRSSTPSAPRPRTPPDGRGRRGGRFSLNAICSAPVANPRGPPVTHAAGPSSR